MIKIVFALVAAFIFIEGLLFGFFPNLFTYHYFFIASPQFNFPRRPGFPNIPDPNEMMNFGNTTVPSTTPEIIDFTEIGPITNGVMNMHNRANKPRK